MSMTMGELFGRAQSPEASEPAKPAQLRLVASGRTVAQGSLGQLAAMPALIVEALP